MSARRVVVTGVGVLSGYGRGASALRTGLASGRSAVRDHSARLGRRAWQRYPMAAFPGDTRALAAELPRSSFVRENQLDEDPDFVAIADAIREALADAGLGVDPERNDVGLVVTHESPGLAPHVQGFFRWGRTARAWLRSKAKWSPAEFLYQEQNRSIYRLHSFLYLHYLSALFRFHGFTLYNNNACSSGAFALAVAADRIRAGEADAIVVAGGDLPEDGTKYHWFRDRGLYSESGRCRPFAVGRDGLVLGSGAAAFVLEEREAALRAGRRPRAEWLGAGFASDGWKVALPDVDHGRYAACIRRAMASAGLAPREVTLIVPHGLGTGLYDRFEAASLAEAFGDGAKEWPALMVLKGALGHTLGGCVLVETAAALDALAARGEVPAAARCADADPALPLGRPREGPLPDRWVLLKCANGFAGQNGAILLRSPEA